MADSNERKREDNNAGKAVGSSVGAFRGDTMSSALDPFGASAGAIASGTQDNKAGEGTDDDDNHGSKKKEKN